jgi:hypothetical protein
VLLKSVNPVGKAGDTDHVSAEPVNPTGVRVVAVYAFPTKPLGSVVFIIVGPPTMATLMVLVAVSVAGLDPAGSVLVAVNAISTGVGAAVLKLVAVPLKTPVALFSVSPVGIDPEDVHATVPPAVKPVAVRVCEYALSFTA